jgi:hypothetical protein
MGGVQVAMYSTIRNLHLLLASLALPFLLMYGISAVQMSSNGWFDMRPSVSEQTLALTAGQTDARAIAREVMEKMPPARGELQNIQPVPAGLNLRLVLPGTVHEVRYTRATGAAQIKTSVGGLMVMLNRLHHAAGLSHDVTAMNVWGAAVASVSFVLLLVGATGIWMWFLRRTERVTGIVLLAINLAFAVTLIVLIRRAGP